MLNLTRLSRALALKIAAVMSVAISLYGIAAAIPFLARGAADLDATVDSPPFPVLASDLAMSVIQLASAYGVWHGQRWAIVVTLLAVLLGILTAAPGVLFAPTTALRLGSLLGLAWRAIIIALCLWRDRKPAVT